MRKWKPEEVMLFVVPLAIVPLAFLAARLKQNLEPIEEPAPVKAPAKPQIVLRPALFGSIVASRDGRLLYTATKHSELPDFIHVWDARTRVFKRSFKRLAEPDISYPLQLSPDGNTLHYVSSRESGFATVLVDTRTGWRRQFQKRRGQHLLHVGSGRYAVASATADSIEMRSLLDGRVTDTVGAVEDGFSRQSICFSLDGSLLAWVANRKSEPGSGDTRSSWTYGDALVVYSLSQKHRTFARTLPGYDIQEVAISGDNTKAIALADYRVEPGKGFGPTQDRKLLVFSLPEGRLLHRLNLGRGHGLSLRPSPDGKWLALQSGDFRRNSQVDWVQTVNLSSGQATLFPQDSTRHSTAFSADSRELFIISSDHRLQLTPAGRWEKMWLRERARTGGK